MTCLHGQEKMVGQTSRTVTVMKDQNFILIEDEEAVSQIYWACDRAGDSSEYESETVMSQTKGGPVLELKKTEGFQERYKDEEDFKHEDIVFGEADREMLLFENLSEKYEFNCEWKPRVNKLCFNSFDEEMKYLEGYIGKYESVEDLVSLDG